MIPKTPMLFEAGSYDLIVIGGGHAGCEAALAAARMNQKTLMLAMNLDSIALLACNPSIGGTAKGHLVREVDALGGQMGLNADATLIQSRMLNTSKGPAVRSLRAQVDKWAYQRLMKDTLEHTPNLTVHQAEAVELETRHGRICAVRTHLNARYEARAVVLAAGVYLRARTITGESIRQSGPSGLFAAMSLTQSLQALGLPLQRFKTGTPPRIARVSVDFSRMATQPGDAVVEPFSFLSGPIQLDQEPCHLTYTNPRTHEIIRANLHRAPMYMGVIEGTGARYCPSIEDKVVRFARRERHQIFLEPEGRGSQEMYVQGLSTSLPLDIQTQALRTVEGLERSVIMRPAYAIEYDCVDPQALTHALMVREIEGLFLAGQVNGTSGYEEAAAQGLLAGINAVQYLRGQQPLTLGRDEAYLGVLVDDLVLKGTNEPYRMMTARAEYRLLLRQDNADLRLTQKGRDIGLVDDRRYDRMCRKREQTIAAIKRMDGTVYPPNEALGVLLSTLGQDLPPTGVTAAELCRRGVSAQDLCALDPGFADYLPQALEQAVIDCRYEGYIERQRRQVRDFRRLEEQRIPEGMDYSAISGLRIEARQKLALRQPETLGQASRISGVTPADIAVLMLALSR